MNVKSDGNSLPSPVFWDDLFLAPKRVHLMIFSHASTSCVKVGSFFRGRPPFLSGGKSFPK